MKLIYTLLITTLATFSFAQGMNEADMQKMMEQAYKAQACMENIDPSSFEEIERKGRAMEKEIKGLCESGQRGKAMSKAMAFAKEFSTSETFLEVQKCAKLMEGMMKNMPVPDLMDETIKDLANGESDEHVCDSI